MRPLSSCSFRQKINRLGVVSFDFGENRPSELKGEACEKEQEKNIIKHIPLPPCASVKISINGCLSTWVNMKRGNNVELCCK